MDHADARALASDYLEDDLEPGTSERIRAHLEKCGPCTSFFNTLRATIGLLRTSRREDPPPSFMDRLRARLRDADSG